MKTILFQNFQVFEGTKSRLRKIDVLIEGSQIKKLLRPSKSNEKGVRKIIRGGGATLMPGLVNAHCHFTYADATSLADITSLPVEENLLITIKNLEKYLAHGFTSVIGMASAKPRLEVVARNAINSGQFHGPRILASTPEYTVTGGVGDDSRLYKHVPSIGIVCDGATEFRKSIRQLIREGVDIVKFNNSGDSFTFGQVSGHVNPMTEQEVAAICETTLNLGKRLAAHSHTDSGVRQCLRYGVEFINHATFATDKTIALLAKKKEKHWVIPAIAARFNTTYEASEWGITEKLAEQIGNKEELLVGCQTMAKMHKQGIRVLPFGDYGFAWLPIGTDARDLEHMVALFGMKPWEALRAATAYGGEAWAGNSGTLIGQIKPNYLADLIIIDGNPLENISLLQDQNHILGVMKNGEFYRTPNM